MNINRVIVMRWLWKNVVCNQKRRQRLSLPPQNCPLHGDLDPIYYIVLWAHPSP